MAEDFRKDATANLTLGQMKLRDEDNLRLVMKSCREIPFNKFTESIVWCNHAMSGIMRKFGINKDKIVSEALALKDDSFIVREFVRNYMADPKNPRDRKTGGLPLPAQALIAAKRLYDEQLKKDVQIEKRDNAYASEKDFWKSGVYVYHHNEIAYFMSAPYKRKGGHYATPHIIVPHIGDKWFIQTNWNEGAVNMAVSK